MKQRLAIDLGSYYVKLVEGYKRNNKFYIEKIGYFPNPFPGFRDSLVEREQDEFAISLKRFIHTNGIKSKRTISNLNATGVVTHYFDIPDLTENEINSAIQLEMIQVTPGGIKNFEYDYLLMQGKDKKKTILFVGCQKDKCDFFINTLQRSGLKPFILDHDSLALLNCYKYFSNTDAEDNTVFILNIGHKSANFVIADGENKFVLVRDIYFGAKNLIEYFANNLNIAPEEAEIYINKQENFEEVKKLVSSNLDDFIVEVRAGLEYSKTRIDKLPTNILITGGGAMIPGVRESLEKMLDIQASVWNPLEHITTPLLSEDIKKKGYLFTVALGLALRDIR